jgi:NAD(P) transhydrogenase
VLVGYIVEMSPETKSYDLLVIGGGPAGIAAATTAADCHKTVALIDSHHELGGAGVNTGTIPSKTLRETALSLSGLRSRNLYGVDLSLRREVTVGDFLGHEQHVRGAFNHLLAKRLEVHKSDVYFGNSTFVDANTVNVQPGDGGQALQLRGDKILIATGSSPVHPAVFTFGKGEIYDSDTVLNLDRIPKTLAVVGAGVIGSEYSCIFAALGAKVHIIDGHDVLLHFLDAEVSQALKVAMENKGIVFHWNQKVDRCSPLDGGDVTLHLASGEEMTVDAVLVAAGRQSNTKDLNLSVTGVEMDERGTIKVGENYQSNVSHIYAAGDVIGFPALASTSMAQGRLAARHALGLEAPALTPLLPTGIYTIPEVSVAGETEESLKKKSIDYVVGRARYEDNARGRIIGDSEGFLKLLFRREDMKLVGVHVMGEQATEIVHIGLLAILYNLTAEALVEVCFNVPTLSMLYRSAALEAMHSISS